MFIGKYKAIIILFPLPLLEVLDHLTSLTYRKDKSTVPVMSQAFIGASKLLRSQPKTATCKSLNNTDDNKMFKVKLGQSVDFQISD